MSNTKSVKKVPATTLVEKAKNVAIAVKAKAAAKVETKTDEAEKPKEYVVGTNKITDETKLAYKSNPKRKNSQAWARYDVYQKAKTFAEYQKLNQDKQAIPDLKYDFSKGFVEIVS